MQQANIERGIQLFQIGRYQDAISYLGKAPNDWTANYYLALCQYNISDYQKADELANRLLSERPDDPSIFYLKAKIALQLDQDKRALEYIDEAISIYPYDADFFGLKGAMLLRKKKFEDALNLVNEGLRINAKNAFCLNTRAQILTKLDRMDEANQTVDYLLHDNPEDSYSHTNVGWVALEQGDHRKAMNHFKQALQYDPNFQYAKDGLSTALKSKNFLYRWYLKYAFWIGNQSTRNQWFFIIGLYLIYQFSVRILDHTGLEIVAIPIIFIYLFFALGGWIMEPLSNAILNFDRFGKYLLDNDQKWSGITFTTLIVLALLALALRYATGFDHFMLIAIASVCAILPLPRAFLAEKKKSRIIGWSYGALILAVGFFGILVYPQFDTIVLSLVLMMMAYTWFGNVFN
ncbi:MAG: tetratricopeptide repeat protein [Leeuwenhoekiella sp.]